MGLEGFGKIEKKFCFVSENSRKFLFVVVESQTVRENGAKSTTTL